MKKVPLKNNAETTVFAGRQQRGKSGILSVSNNYLPTILPFFQGLQKAVWVISFFLPRRKSHKTLEKYMVGKNLIIEKNVDVYNILILVLKFQ